MAVDHYENFPVGSVLVPRRLRKPIHAIYAFARTADDYADEGDADNATRLAQLQALSDELALIEQGKRPVTSLMQRLQDEAIAPFALPTQLFEDLLSAFRQDVVQKRYQEFAGLVDYSRRSANPVGRLLLCLYGVSDEKSLAQSDGICTALQLINFWQDVAVDWRKDRVYLPLQDMAKFGVNEDDIAVQRLTPEFKRLMAYECEKAFKMLQAGSGLVHQLPGRLGWELRLIVLGGQRILQKLDEAGYDVFEHRPELGRKDWWWMLKQLVKPKAKSTPSCLSS